MFKTLSALPGLRSHLYLFTTKCLDINCQKNISLKNCYKLVSSNLFQAYNRNSELHNTKMNSMQTVKNIFTSSEKNRDRKCMTSYSQSSSLNLASKGR